MRPRQARVKLAGQRDNQKFINSQRRRRPTRGETSGSTLTLPPADSGRLLSFGGSRKPAPDACRASERLPARARELMILRPSANAALLCAPNDLAPRASCATRRTRFETCSQLNPPAARWPQFKAALGRESRPKTSGQPARLAFVPSYAIKSVRRRGESSAHCCHCHCRCRLACQLQGAVRIQFGKLSRANSPPAPGLRARRRGARIR